MAAAAHITLTVDGETVGYLREANVQESSEMLPAAAVHQYGFTRSIPGLMSWGASGSVFVAARGSDLGQAALRSGVLERQSVSLSVTYADGSVETGTALVTAWEVASQIGAAVEGSFTLQGVGALT